MKGMHTLDEKKLRNSGFSVLQEKENMIYYEKFTENEEQLFVIFDRETQKIKSIDSYSFNQDGMKIAKKDVFVS